MEIWLSQENTMEKPYGALLVMLVVTAFGFAQETAVFTHDESPY
jgi:hypothetical protein